MNDTLDAHDRRERRRGRLMRAAEIVVVTIWLLIIGIVWDAGT